MPTFFPHEQATPGPGNGLKIALNVMQDFYTEHIIDRENVCAYSPPLSVYDLGMLLCLTHC